MLSDFGSIGIFLLLTIAFPLAAMGTAWMARPKPVQDEEKLKVYECGVDTKGKTWIHKL